MKAFGNALKNMKKKSHSPAPNLVEGSLEEESIESPSEEKKEEGTDRAPKGVKKHAHVSAPIHGDQMHGEIAMDPNEAASGLGPEHLDALASMLKNHNNGREAIGLDERARVSAHQQIGKIKSKNKKV